MAERLTEDGIAALEFFAWPYGLRKMMLSACQELRERRAADLTETDYQELAIARAELTAHGQGVPVSTLNRLIDQYEARHAR